MAETDPVKIAVEIISSVEDDVAEIKAELESLGKDINVDVNVDDNGDIESLNLEKSVLEKPTSSTHRFESRGFKRMLARKKMLESDLDETIDFIGLRGQQALADMGGPVGAAQSITDQIPTDEFGERLHPIPRSGLSAISGGPDIDFRELQAGKPAVAPLDDFIERASELADDVGLPEFIERNNKGFSDMSSKLNNLRPNIMQVWNALATLIPVFVTMAGAAIGAAGALVAVGTAAAAIGGVGLLGWGDDAQSSLQAVKEEAVTAFKDINDILQPAATEFQPILEGWIEGAPGQVQRLVAPLRNLTALEDEISRAGSGLVGWLGTVLNVMSRMDAEVGVILQDFGTVFGRVLIDVMSNFVRWTAENTDQIIMLGSVLRDLMGIVFNLSTIVAFVVGRFGFLFEATKILTDLLANEHVRAILTALSVYWALRGAIYALTAIKQAYAATTMGTVLPAIYSYISGMLEAVIATNALRAAIAGLLTMTGVGLLAVGAGQLMSQYMVPDTPSGGLGNAERGSRSGGNTQIYVDGDVGRREMDRIIDKMESESRGEIRANEAMNGG